MERGENYNEFRERENKKIKERLTFKRKKERRMTGRKWTEEGQIKADKGTTTIRSEILRDP